MKNGFRFLCFIILSFFFAVCLWAAHAVFILNDIKVYAENGPLENIQAGLIVISGILFLTPFAIEAKTEKLFLIFCFWLSCGFVLRELDIERFDLPDPVKLIGSGVGRNILLGLGFASIFCYAAIRFSHYKRASHEFLKSKTGILLMLGGLFLVIGSLFEVSTSINQNVLFEELFELGGYCFILVSAITTNFILPTSLPLNDDSTKSLSGS